MNEGENVDPLPYSHRHQHGGSETEKIPPMTRTDDEKKRPTRKTMTNREDGATGKRTAVAC